MLIDHRDQQIVKSKTDCEIENLEIQTVKI